MWFLYFYILCMNRNIKFILAILFTHETFRSHWKVKNVVVEVSHWSIFVCFFYISMWYTSVSLPLLWGGAMVGGIDLHWWETKCIQALVCEPRCQAQCHKGVFDGRERKRQGGWEKRNWMFLGQRIVYSFKPEHSTGCFSKCQSHFWLWSDGLMDRCT